MQSLFSRLAEPGNLSLMTEWTLAFLSSSFVSLYQAGEFRVKQEIKSDGRDAMLLTLLVTVFRSILIRGLYYMIPVN